MTKTPSSSRFTVVLLALVLTTGSLLVSVADAALKKKPPVIPATLTGSVNLTDKTWVCDGPVNLDSVKITISAKVKVRTDAIHLRPGCTGKIANLEVTQYVGDAVKVAEGVHDLVVGGGTISCLAKLGTLHQDGIQAMGGERITFNNMAISCGRENDTLISSNFFVNRAGKSTVPPSDIVCDRCTLGGWTAHTVNVQDSLRSGIRNSTLCVGRFPKLTMTIGSGAVSPVNTGNRIAVC